MPSERDQQVVLEVRHNVSALDPETILPWSRADFSEDDDVSTRVERLTEALYLTMILKEEVGGLDPLLDRRIDTIKDTLKMDRSTEQIITSIDAMAREKVRKVWHHTP